MDTRDEWTRRIDDDEQVREVCRNSRCRFWECVALASLAALFGAVTGLAVWRSLLVAVVAGAGAAAVWLW